jgi:maltose O-acetyltransferase
VIGSPIYNQPTLLLDKGTIIFYNIVNLGFNPSPYFYSGYGYIEERNEYSKIIIGDNVWINNNFYICSEGEGIEIVKNTLIGVNVEIIDSDFHDLHPGRRINRKPKTEKVIIEDNVFIGNNLKILKGVGIGKNSVIANGSILTKSIPANVIAGGNPAKVIRKIELD